MGAGSERTVCICVCVRAAASVAAMKKIYLEFKEVASGSKLVRAWHVVSLTQKTVLGLVRWFPHWRQYTLSTGDEVVWSPGCLREVADFMERETAEHNRGGRRSADERQTVA